MHNGALRMPTGQIVYPAIDRCRGSEGGLESRKNPHAQRAAEEISELVCNVDVSAAAAAAAAAAADDDDDDDGGGHDGAVQLNW